MMAAGFKLFGISTLTIKLPSIILGILTVLGIYLLGRELFPLRHRIALFATYFCAVSFWAVNFSRIGFRAIAMLPVLCFTFYFLFRGIRTGASYNYIFAGIICGLGFHTYTAFRVMPLFLIVLLGLFLVADKNFIRTFWRQIALFFISMLIVVTPLLATFYAHPEYLSSRTGDVSIFSAENRDESLPVALTHSITSSLAKFNFSGDLNWRHGFPPFPTLEPLTGLLFIGGLFLMCRLFFSTAWRRMRHTITTSSIVIPGLLITWLFVFLAPEFLTSKGLPHSLRSLGVLPAVFLIAAYGLDALLRQKFFSPHARKCILILFLFYVGAFGYIKYHVFWASRTETAVAFNKELRDIAYHIADHPSQKVIVVERPLKAMAIRTYTTHHPDITYIDKAKPHHIVLEEGAIVYQSKQRSKTIKALQEKYGAGNIIEQSFMTSGGSTAYTIRLK